MFAELIDNHSVSARQKLIFVICLLVLIIDGMDFALLAFATPVLLVEWHTTKAQLAPALASALIGMAIGAALGGYTGDRMGARRTLIWAVLIFGVTTFLSAAAANIPQLLVLRFLSGLGFGIAVPIGMGIASEWCPKRRRGQLISVMAIGTTTGATLGGLLSAWVIPAFGWHSIFIVSGVITMVVAAIIIKLLPESLSFLIRSQRQAEAVTWIERIMGEQIGKLATLASVQNAKANKEETGGRLMTSENLRVNVCLWIAFFSISYTAFGFLTWSPTVFVSAGALLPDAIRSTSAYTFAATFGCLAGAFFLPKMGSRLLLMVALIVTICATMILSGMLSPGQIHILQISLAMAVAGLTAGCAQSVIYAVAAMAYPSSYRSTGMGVCIGFSRVGGITSIFTGGMLLQFDQNGPGLFFGVLTGMLVIGLIALVSMHRHIPKTVSEGVAVPA